MKTLHRIDPIKSSFKRLAHAVSPVVLACCLASQAQAQWTYSAWTGDPDSGITNASPYTVAVNCAGVATTVNGVAFEASATFGTNFSIGGDAAIFPGATTNVTGDSSALASSFIYNGNPRTVTLTNLTPGLTYETSLFSFGWEDSGRSQTFASGGDSIVLDQDFYGNQNGIRITYTFVADPSGSQVLTITPGGGGTFHMSALANKQVSASVPQARITNFGPGATIGPVAANAAAISWFIPFGSDPAALSPTFTLSPGATCTVDGTPPVSGETRNFTSPVHYIVYSSDYVSSPPSGTFTDYTVTVTVAPDEATLLWDVAGGGPWNLFTANWKGQSSGVTMPFSNGKNVIFDNAAGGTIILDGNLSPLSTTVNAASGTYAFGGGTIATGSLTKNGGGRLLMAKANDYAGGTIIQNGTLELQWPGDGVSHTTLGSGPVTLNDGTLHLNRTDLANALTVNGGSLFLDNGFGNAWTGPVTLNAPNLNVTAFYQVHSFSGAISGTGGFTLSSLYGGGLALSGTNDYTGPTTVTSGTLRCDSPGALGGGALSITGVVNLNYSGTKTIASLTLGGTPQTTPGTYGSVASGATFQNNTYFTPGSTGTVTLGGASDYDTWLTEFTFAPGADKTPTGDPDGDGVSNQDEYAFGLNPTLGSSVNPIVSLLDPVTGNFQYTRRATPAATGLTYTVLTSTTLAGWAAGGATETGFTTDGNIQTVTVNVTAPPVGGKLFVRVEAAPAS